MLARCLFHLKNSWKSETLLEIIKKKVYIRRSTYRALYFNDVVFGKSGINFSLVKISSEVISYGNFSALSQLAHIFAIEPPDWNFIKTNRVRKSSDSNSFNSLSFIREKTCAPAFPLEKKKKKKPSLDGLKKICR